MVKPGVKSTEFYLALGGLVPVLLRGLTDPVAYVRAIAVGCVPLIVWAYVWGRAKAKGGEVCEG